MSKRILVADDEPTARTVVVQCLKNAGYSTTIAADGVQAVEAAENEKPDLILLDLLLPRRDGYAVLLDLRSRPSTRHTPIVIVSGEDGRSQASVARTLGAQGYIGKPFRPDDLLGQVADALRGGGGA